MAAAAEKQKVIVIYFISNQFSLSYEAHLMWFFITIFFPYQAEAARNVASQNIPSNFKDLIQNLVSVNIASTQHIL